MKAHSTLLTLGLMLGLSLCAKAENKAVNPDELPHNMIPLPNGTRVLVITYQENNYRVVNPNELSTADYAAPEICFEAKFNSITEPDRLKLFGVRTEINVVVDERLKQRAKTEPFKHGDNLWFCGSLRRGSKGFDFTPVEIFKMPPDQQRHETKIVALEKKQDAEGLLDEGQRIEQLRKTEPFPFSVDEQLINLRDRAFDSGLTLKEKSIREDDADAMFALALQWRTLRKNNRRLRDLVERCLKVKPDHPEAARVAEEELGLVRFEGFWISKDRKQEILAQRAADDKRHQQEMKELSEARARDRARAEVNRPMLLVDQMKNFRSTEAGAREKAIESLSEAARKTLDPGFAEEALDILLNLTEKSAVTKGLEKISKSDVPEVRRHTFEALVWRGAQQDPQAFDILAAALSSEKDSTTAKVGIEALSSLGGKAAVDVLVKGLSNDDRAVSEDMVEALKNLTKQTMPTKSAWAEWWSKNKDTFN